MSKRYEQMAKTIKEDPASRRLGASYNAELDELDLAILKKFRYGETKILARKLKIPESASLPTPALLETLIEQLLDKDKPDWLARLTGLKPRRSDGSPDPEYYRRSIAFLTATALYQLSTHNKKLDVEPLVKALIIESKQLGLDLSTELDQDLFGWLKDTDMMEATDEQLVALLREVLKIPTDTVEQERLKKNWFALFAVTYRLRAFCRSNCLAAWVYIGRSQHTGKVFDLQPFHIEAAWAMINFSRVLLVMPTGHGKTELLHGISLIQCAKKPNTRWGMLFNTKDVSKRVLYVRQYLTHPRLRALFPKVTIDKERSDSSLRFSLLKYRPTIEPTVEGSSVLQKGEGNRYDLLTADDLITAKSVLDPKEVTRVIHMFTNTWEKRLEPGGRTMVIMTRWTDNDLGALLLDRAKHRGNWAVLVYTVGKKTTKDGPIPGQSLWPSRFPEAGLLDEFRENSLTFSRDRWANPISESDYLVRKVCYYRHDDKLPITKRVLSVDPAGEAKITSDFWGSTVWGLGHDSTNRPRAWCKNAARMKRHADTMVKYIVEQMVPTYNIDEILMEAVGAFVIVARMLNKALEAAKSPARLIIPKRPYTDKAERLRWAAPALERGSLLFPGHLTTEGWVPQPNVEWLINDLMRFGVAANDDGVDSVTQFANHYASFLDYQLPTKSPQESKSREQEHLERVLGLDQITGGDALDELEVFGMSSGAHP